MRELIARDMADAAVAQLSPDRRFATAYNAALQTAKIAVACAGYRITARIGHHKISLESAMLALGKSAGHLTDYFEICRRKRNKIDYTQSHVATGTEAKEIVAKAKEFYELVESWISTNHPKFVK